MLQAESKVAELRQFMDTLYNKSGRTETLLRAVGRAGGQMAQNLTGGVPFATRVFDGASERNRDHAATGVSPMQLQGQRVDAYTYPGTAV
jgi:hypothetical protein